VGVEVAGALAAAGVVFAATTGLDEATVVVVGAVVVVLVALITGELEEVVAINAVDVDAMRATGVLVETEGDEVASTWAEASRISKMLANPATNSTRRLIPDTAMMLGFISFSEPIKLIINCLTWYSFCGILSHCLYSSLNR
jgi:hypothetical protein